MRKVQVQHAAGSTEEDFVRQQFWSSRVAEYELASGGLTVTVETPLNQEDVANTSKLIWFRGGPNGVWKVETIDKSRKIIALSSPQATPFEWFPLVVHEDENWTLHRAVQSEEPIECGIMPPLIAYCRTTIFNVFDIDTVSQNFRADVFFELRFRFIGMLDAPKEWVRELLAIFAIQPSIVECLNTVSIDGDLQSWSTYTPSPLDTTLMDYCFKLRYKACFSEQLELAEFPFDQQPLNLALTINQPITHIVLRSNDHYPSLFMLNLFASENVFVVVTSCNVLTQVCMSDPSESSSGNRYAAITFQIVLQRKPGYYISNVLVPVTILTYLGFLSFGIVAKRERMATADRIATSITLLLTTVAYKFVIAGALPQISYLTSLDRYVTCTSLMMVAFAVENALFPWLCTDADECFDVEQSVMWIMLAIYTAGILVSAVVVWFSRRKLDKANKVMIEQHQLRLLVAKKHPKITTKARYAVYKKLLHHMQLPPVTIVCPREHKVQTRGLGPSRETEAINFLSNIAIPEICK